MGQNVTLFCNTFGYTRVTSVEPLGRTRISFPLTPLLVL